MKFRKTLILTAMVLLAAVCLAGCMNNVSGDAPDATNAPDYMPQGTQIGADTGSRFDWTKDVSRIEGQIGRISEIAECRVVVTGDTALAGVKFDDAYEGQLTERIREMVAAEIMEADPKIQTVAVTADEEDVKKVYELADRMLSDQSADTLKEDALEIVRNATTLR